MDNLQYSEKLSEIRNSQGQMKAYSDTINLNDEIAQIKINEEKFKEQFKSK